MPIVILIVVGFIASTASKQGELYFYDPGPAEYLLSFIFAGGIIAGVTGFLKKL